MRAQGLALLLSMPARPARRRAGTAQAELLLTLSRTMTGKVADEMLCHGAVLLSTDHARSGGKGEDRWCTRQQTRRVTQL